MTRIIRNFSVGWEALQQNRLRALLTSLGVVFGVASVIAMLAIGRGAEAEILEQMRLLGAENIIVRRADVKQSGAEPVPQTPGEEEESQPYSPGLRLDDALDFARITPIVKFASPEVSSETNFVAGGRRLKGKLVGVDEHYFKAAQLEIAEGAAIAPAHLRGGAQVCVIGWDVKTRLFADREAAGAMLKCGPLWLEIIGVTAPKNVSKSQQENLGVRNFDQDVYMPVTTYLLRFENRALVTREMIQQAARSDDDEENAESKPPLNYHQIDQITVRAANTNYARPAADALRRFLLRRHNNVADFEVVIPEELLAQEKRTKEMFKYVLLAIASIALLVGGVGIMNIMLASVLERTREIGVRRSMGATREDIILQFLSESVAISLLGGLAGVALGVGLSYAVEVLADIRAIVTWEPVAVAFAVSAGVGLLFGIMPARRAAARDPVESLRYD